MAIIREEIKGIPVYVIEGSVAPNGSGISCRFFVLPSGMGLKVYGNRDECHLAYWGQRVAAKFKLAPDAGELCLVRIGNERGFRTYYGYTTDVCGSILRTLPVEVTDTLLSSADLKATKQRLSDLIAHKFDHHAGNFAVYPKTGKVVAIDFGFDSFSRSIAEKLVAAQAEVLDYPAYTSVQRWVDVTRDLEIDLAKDDKAALPAAVAAKTEAVADKALLSAVAEAVAAGPRVDDLTGKYAVLLTGGAFPSPELRLAENGGKNGGWADALAPIGGMIVPLFNTVEKAVQFCQLDSVAKGYGNVVQLKHRPTHFIPTKADYEVLLDRAGVAEWNDIGKAAAAAEAAMQNAVKVMDAAGVPAAA